MRWQFIKSVLRHKWAVWVAGRRLRVPRWRLLLHDLSKFSRAEFAAYAQHFYGDGHALLDFEAAWLHHQNHNDHHWQWWAGRDGNTRFYAVDQAGAWKLFSQDYEPLPPGGFLVTVPSVAVTAMPEVCVREMIADWFAAGKVYAGAWPDPANYTWYKENRPRMHLHPTTEMRIGLVLVEAAQWDWK